MSKETYDELRSRDNAEVDFKEFSEPEVNKQEEDFMGIDLSEDMRWEI